MNELRKKHLAISNIVTSSGWRSSKAEYLRFALKPSNQMPQHLASTSYCDCARFNAHDSRNF